MRAIVIPNPAETTVRRIGHAEFVSHSHTAVNPWRDQLEPIDLNRHLLAAHSFEIDYYHNFINERLAGLRLNPSTTTTAAVSPTLRCPISATANLQLCDVDDTARRAIRLLQLDDPADGVIRGPDQCHLLAALTTTSAHDIHDQRRHSHLGTSTIQLLVSLYLLHSRPDWHAGWLHTALRQLTGNAALAHSAATSLQLADRVQSTPFAARTGWSPPLTSVPAAVRDTIVELNASPHTLFRLKLDDDERRTGRVASAKLMAFVESFLHDEQRAFDASAVDATMGVFVGQQRVDAAQLADSARAVIGVCVAAAGLRRTADLMQAMGMLRAGAPGVGRLNATKFEFGNVGELRTARLRPDEARRTDAGIDALLINASRLEALLGHTFADRGWLLQALTHPTFPDNRYTDCNQVLAFVGAALCDFLLTAYISERADHLAADELRDLRAALVSATARACYVVRGGLHLHMLAAQQALGEKVAAFVEFQAKHEWRLTDAVLLLIEETDERMAEFVDVPSALGDLFAALMAAVWFDAGGDLEVVWRCLWSLVRVDVDGLMWSVPRDLVWRLDKWPGAKPKYERAHRDGDLVMVAVQFTLGAELVQVQGFGRTEETAKLAAAKVALHALMQ